MPENNSFEYRLGTLEGQVSQLVIIVDRLANSIDSREQHLVSKIDDLSSSLLLRKQTYPQIFVASISVFLFFLAMTGGLVLFSNQVYSGPLETQITQLDKNFDDHLKSDGHILSQVNHARHEEKILQLQLLREQDRHISDITREEFKNSIIQLREKVISLSIR